MRGAFSFKYSPRPGTPGGRTCDEQVAGRRQDRAARAPAGADRPPAARRSTRAAVGRTCRRAVREAGPPAGPARRPLALSAAGAGRWRRAHMIGEMVPVDDHRTSAPTACSACSPAARESRQTRPRRWKRSEPEALRNLPTDNVIVPAASEANDTATTQAVLTFDDNRLASDAVRPIRPEPRADRAPARRRGDQRGNQVTLEGSREACEQARRVLEGLYERLKRGHDLALGDVDGAIRLAIAQGSLFDFDPPAGALRLRGDQPAQAPGARAHRRRRTPTSARSSAMSSSSPPARPAPARPGSRSPMRSRCSSARRSTASSCRGRRSRPASGSAFCPATCARRSIPICARSTTRSTT